MNRHFQAYNALPCAPLGEPKGAEKQQASDGEWKPLRPGYESRTLAGGATEVRSTLDSLEEMVTRPDESPASQSREPAYQPEGFDFAYIDRKGRQDEAIPKRPEPAALAAPEPKQAPAAADVPAAPTEWQSGPPPSVGWFAAQDDYDRVHDATHFARYFNGVAWSHWTDRDYSVEVKRAWLDQLRRLGGPPTDAGAITWRGPRLTGDSWPEPQQ